MCYEFYEERAYSMDEELRVRCGRSWSAQGAGWNQALEIKQNSSFIILKHPAILWKILTGCPMEEEWDLFFIMLSNNDSGCAYSFDHSVLLLKTQQGIYMLFG